MVINERSFDVYGTILESNLRGKQHNKVTSPRCVRRRKPDGSRRPRFACRGLAEKRQISG
eukprot:5283358-Lingulodinium_polyedra.AAC.1